MMYDFLSSSASFLRRPAVSAVAVLAVVAALVGIVPIIHAEDGERFDGEYYWPNGRSRGPLEAVFVATGEGRWDVAFHFVFNGQPHTYEGTADGSLSDGRLEGRVENENGRRTWTFEGEFRDGSFDGRHAEIIRGKARQSGSLTLSAGE